MITPNLKVVSIDLVSLLGKVSKKTEKITKKFRNIWNWEIIKVIKELKMAQKIKKPGFSCKDGKKEKKNTFELQSLVKKNPNIDKRFAPRSLYSCFRENYWITLQGGMKGRVFLSTIFVLLWFRFSFLLSWLCFVADSRELGSSVVFFREKTATDALSWEAWPTLSPSLSLTSSHWRASSLQAPLFKKQLKVFFYAFYV